MAWQRLKWTAEEEAEYMRLVQAANRRRADTAQIALDAFVDTDKKCYKEMLADGEMDTVISDLIASLMHLAQQNGFDAVAVVESAATSFSEEQTEE